MRALQLAARLTVLPVALTAAVLSWLWLQQTVLAGGAPPGVPGSGVAGETSVKADVSARYACSAGEWRFVITGLQGHAPKGIVVKWSNGAEETVALTGFAFGKAEFATRSNLNASVVSAETNVQPSWNGTFVIAHGPIDCTEVAGIQTTGQEPGEQIPVVPAVALYPAIGAAAYGIARITRRRG